MIKIDWNLVDKEVLQALSIRAEEITFRRNEVVVEAGKTCHYIYFITQGMLRSFYYDRKGKDITNWFANEDMIITAAQSFFKREPSVLNIQAIEASTVRAISYDQLEEVFREYQSLERFGRIIMTEIMMAVGKKAMFLQGKTAEERYHELIKTHPDIFQRAKLGHIAGYLGITQQSLSRIRGRSS